MSEPEKPATRLRLALRSLWAAGTVIGAGLIAYTLLTAHPADDVLDHPLPQVDATTQADTEPSESTPWGNPGYVDILPESVKVDEPEQSGLISRLARAARKTRAAYMDAMKSYHSGIPQDIPSRYWAPGIQALDPIKVYTHRVNVVVVQKEVKGIERGLYIYIPESSYLPTSGDDGFTFTPDAGPSDALAFKRDVHIGRKKTGN